MHERSWTIGQIARTIGASLEGDPSTAVRALSSIDAAGPNELTFAVDERRAKGLSACRAAAVLTGENVPVPPRLPALRVADVEAGVVAVLALMAEPEDLPPVGVHPSAVIDPSARLGTGVAIGPYVVIGRDANVEDGVVLCAHVCLGAAVHVGAGSVFMPGVAVRERCRVGRRCRIHPNAVIGADGFGYYTRRGVHHKVPHVGTVEIGDDVEIGACVCIDRAKFGATRVGDGSKIDNLVQVAHNVQLGRGVLLAALVGVAGSATVGDQSILGGHVGVRDNVSIGRRVRIAAYAAAFEDVPADTAVGGAPAFALREFLRAAQVYRRLPEMRRQLKDLRARIDELESQTDDDRRRR